MYKHGHTLVHLCVQLTFRHVQACFCLYTQASVCVSWVCPCYLCVWLDVHMNEEGALGSTKPPLYEDVTAPGHSQCPTGHTLFFPLELESSRTHCWQAWARLCAACHSQGPALSAQVWPPGHRHCWGEVGITGTAQAERAVHPFFMFPTHL